MSINRVGTALVAAVGCLVATDLSQAVAAEPGQSSGRPIQVKPVAKGMKIEMTKIVKKAESPEVGNRAKANDSSQGDSAQPIKLVKKRAAAAAHAVRSSRSSKDSL